MFALLVSIEGSDCSLEHAAAAGDGSSLASGAASRVLGKVLDGKGEGQKSEIEGR